MTRAGQAVAFHDFEPEQEHFLDEVVRGLSKPQKELSAKFFYDARGSALFQKICGLKEYYLTRTELQIIDSRAPEIAEMTGPNPVVIEFGSGSNHKFRALLQHLGRLAAYISIDISKEHLLSASAELAQSHPGLQVIAVCADYTKAFELPEPLDPSPGRRLGLFFGSTIGNFTPIQAVRFLSNAASALASGGVMVVGVDLKKDPNILEAAYNDRLGVTAAFNLNLLERINRELGADFDPDGFAHRAHYVEDRGRVEMHLVSRKSQTVSLGSRRFRFARGETIHTENSYKFAIEEFQEMAEGAGFMPRRAWTDTERMFSVHFLQAA